MKAVITVTGKDAVGIIAKVSTECAKYNANVVDVTQSVLQELFVMIMLIDISALNCEFNDFTDKMKAVGPDMGLVIHVMHEDIFNSMHRI